VNDVTEILNSYRDCARALWNGYLRPSADFDRVDAFAGICELLFAELVLRRLQKTDQTRKSSSEPYSFLHVVPTADLVPIMIHRPRSTDQNRYWDDSVDQVPQSSTSLLYIDYFDWDQMGYIDFEYYRVKIARFDTQPQVVGREALVKVHHAKILVS
jgi:hypothetical protein